MIRAVLRVVGDFLGTVLLFAVASFLASLLLRLAG